MDDTPLFGSSSLAPTDSDPLLSALRNANAQVPPDLTNSQAFEPVDFLSEAPNVPAGVASDWFATPPSSSVAEASPASTNDDAITASAVEPVDPPASTRYLAKYPTGIGAGWFNYQPSGDTSLSIAASDVPEDERASDKMPNGHLDLEQSPGMRFYAPFMAVNGSDESGL